MGNTENFLKKPSGKTVANGGPWMYARVDLFDAEIIDNNYKKLNLFSMVYVTSSDDPNIPPGVHRLADINVFANAPSCGFVSYAKCKTPGWGLNDFSRGLKLDLYTFGEQPTDRYISGIEWFPRARIHLNPVDYPTAPNKESTVYKGFNQCDQNIEPYMRYKLEQGSNNNPDISIPELLKRLNYSPPPPNPPPLLHHRHLNRRPRCHLLHSLQRRTRGTNFRILSTRQRKFLHSSALENSGRSMR